MSTTVRYEPPEKPPPLLAAGLGAQQAALCVASIILTPVIIVRAADGSETYLVWAVFAALLASGLTTILQAVRLGPLGAGYPIVMGTSGAFIAVSVAALAEGGPAMLATLVLISALFQFGLAARLAWVRRIITPTVAGTVIMLIAVTVMPLIFDMLDVQGESSAAAAPVSAGVTLLVIVGLALRARGRLRLWVPMIGLLVGCIVSSFFGLYDSASVAEADWIGIPSGGWPGYNVDFGVTFWALLPAFIFVTLIGAIETIGDSSAVQAVAWRKPRATNFREVQGGVAADGVGNLLSGIAGTVPNTTYSTSIAITELTGIASRLVGVWIGVVFLLTAFVPKLAALLLAIPGPVAAAYITVLLAMLFVLGLKMVVGDGLDYRKGVIVGVSFWIGVGFQHQVIFAEQLGEWWGSLLGNGMTAGGLAAMALTVLTSSPRRRIETALDVSSLPAIQDFLEAFAARRKWSADAIARLRSAGEEALLSLAGEGGSSEAHGDRRLLVTIRGNGADVELEFLAAAGNQNLQDLIVLLPDSPENAEREVSLRLLRHAASSVRHEQYHGADILLVRVDGESR